MICFCESRGDSQAKSGSERSHGDKHEKYDNTAHESAYCVEHRNYLQVIITRSETD